MEKNEPKGCCALQRDEGETASVNGDAAFLQRAMSVPRAQPEVTAELRARLASVPGGIFEMGARKSTYPADLDSPRRKVKLRPFLMSPFAVTNADFARFVAETGYRTVAEQEGWSFVFHLLLSDPSAWPQSPVGIDWWRRVDGACWSAPEGPGSDIGGRPDHPVVHVAWYDALAYCNWSGLRLPTEAEWERAARGGLTKRKFPWGDELKPGGDFAMNTFQGEFPLRNTAEDGWLGTAPVDAFRPNGYGMFNMTGNVWEWVGDLFGAHPVAGRLPDLNPRGPQQGYARVQRGGSYLCHVSYCDRYHVHSRTRNDPDSSTGNCGFRIASDAPPSN